jgi:uncharacterized protein (DUF433 family)
MVQGERGGMSTEAHPQPPQFNLGVYSLPEAARLVQRPRDWVSRVVKGYRFRRRNGQPGSTPPLFRGQFEDLEGTINLSFLDLIELVFVRDFRAHGVSWPVIRRAAEEAAKLFKDTDHPFCVKRFSTDGSQIFATAAAKEEGEEQMIDLAQRQHVFAEILKPFIKQLEYSASGDLLRWFPLGKEKPVVLDPRISFGEPTVEGAGVPTAALYKALKAGESEDAIATWYDLPQDAVRAALDFERRLAE